MLELKSSHNSSKYFLQLYLVILFESLSQKTELLCRLIKCKCQELFAILSTLLQINVYKTFYSKEKVTMMIIKFEKSWRKDRRHWKFFVVSLVSQIPEEFLTLERLYKEWKKDNTANGRRTLFKTNSIMKSIFCAVFTFFATKIEMWLLPSNTISPISIDMHKWQKHSHLFMFERFTVFRLKYLIYSYTILWWRRKSKQNQK